MSKVVLRRKGITEEEWTGRNISYISWNEDKTFKDIRSEPDVGRSVVLDLVQEVLPEPGMTNFTWMTSPITEVLSKKEDSRFEITEVKTQNSEYEVLIPKK